MESRVYISTIIEHAYIMHIYHETLMAKYAPAVQMRAHSEQICLKRSLPRLAQAPFPLLLVHPAIHTRPTGITRQVR